MTKILIVDDEPDIKSLFLQKFRGKIREREWAFDFCHNGEEALKALQEDKGIDLVLSDINMPKMDGLSLLEKIQSLRLNVATVIVSAYGDMGNIRTAMSRGAFDFITKPIDFEDVELTLNKTIKHIQSLKRALSDQNRLLSLKKELELAKKIQESVLPPPLSPSPRCAIFAQMIPAREVGGDYYDFFLIDKDHLAFVIADVSGKGISSALFALVCQTLFKSLAPQALSPKKSLQAINSACSKNNESCMFATAFYGLLNLKTGELYYTNAGHASPYKVNSEGKVKALPATEDIPLGVRAKAVFGEKSSRLEPGDLLALYTDGVTEAQNAKQEEFGEKRLEKILQKSAGQSPKSAGESLLNAVRRFAGEAKAYDDITFLLLKYN